MARHIRDAIHGDIRLPELEAAIVDTQEFQRLRYIKQNGLLHFVFPGAVHTRFIHSLGTLAVARKIFSHLFFFIDRDGTFEQRKELKYLRKVFLCTALLHDVGHCAFSHSIEGVSINGNPLLGLIEDFAKTWDASDFLEEVTREKPLFGKKELTHEKAGTILFGRILADSGVQKCLTDLGFNANDFLRDIRALHTGLIKRSESFDRSIMAVLPLVQKGILEGPILGIELDEKQLAGSLFSLMASLISGTLDADRMDYLLRDSHYTGVEYGLFDMNYLIQNLCLVINDGALVLGLKEKAVHTLDDLLWSRYQMFIQIYNHKSNVALNMVLGEAIEAGIKSDILLNPVVNRSAFLGYTDDYVISNILMNYFQGGNKEEACVKVLVKRQFPNQIAQIDLKEIPEEKQSAFLKKRIKSCAKNHGLDPGIFMYRISSSTLIKHAPVPVIVSQNRIQGDIRCRKYAEGSLFRVGKADPLLPSIHRIGHLYIPR